MSCGPWQPHKRTAALILAAAGWRPKAIASVLGVSVVTAKAWTQRPAPVIEDETKLRALVRRLRREGWTRPEIASVSQLTVVQVERLDGTSWRQKHLAKPEALAPARPAAATEKVPQGHDGEVA